MADGAGLSQCVAGCCLGPGWGGVDPFSRGGREGVAVHGISAASPGSSGMGIILPCSVKSQPQTQGALPAVPGTCLLQPCPGHQLCPGVSGCQSISACWPAGLPASPRHLPSCSLYRVLRVLCIGPKCSGNKADRVSAQRQIGTRGPPLCAPRRGLPLPKPLL